MHQSITDGHLAASSYDDFRKCHSFDIGKETPFYIIGIKKERSNVKGFFFKCFVDKFPSYGFLLLCGQWSRTPVEQSVEQIEERDLE